MAEGLPADADPSDIVEAALMARERRRAELQALAVSFCASIGVCLGGGDASAILRPFYTESEWERVSEERERIRQENAEMEQIRKLRRLTHG